MSGTRINWWVKNSVRVGAFLAANPDRWFTVPEIADTLGLSQEGADYALTGSWCVDCNFNCRRVGAVNHYQARDKLIRSAERYAAIFARRWGVEASLLSTAEERKRMQHA